MYIYIYIYILANVVEGEPKASFSKATNDTKVLERALLLSLDCSTLPLVLTLKC